MRAMPSPTSMTVPTSLTCTFCSKPAISCFRMLVISATLMAILILRFDQPRRHEAHEVRQSNASCPSWLRGSNSFRAGGEQPLAHRLQLVFHAGVDQAVLHAEHQAADDVLVHVLV